MIHLITEYMMALSHILHHYELCFTLWELDIALGGKGRPQTLSHVTHMVKFDDA